jgi:DNA-directed RNA polymerase specialized sigma24 family protein
VSSGIDKGQSSGQDDVDWKTVVERIRAGDQEAQEVLYHNFASGARLFLQRRLGMQDVDDRLHDLYVIVVQSIQQGDIREPERLMGFVRTVLNRRVAAEISLIVHAREHSIDLDSTPHLRTADLTPEQEAANHQTVTIMMRVLSKMKKSEYEVLTRFYLLEQAPEQIRKELGLTDNQFNLLKSRAKARLTKLFQGSLGPRRSIKNDNDGFFRATRAK